MPFNWSVLKRLALLATIAVACPVLASANQPADGSPLKTYSRELFKPLEKYSYESVQAMVAAIRAEGHPILTGHPRIFIRPDNREALRAKIGTHYKNWMQEAVNLVNANWGKTLADPGGVSDEPDVQPVVLACGIIYQMGEVAGVNYLGRSPREYGLEGVRHLLSFLNLLETPTASQAHVEWLIPLAYDWLYDLMFQQDHNANGRPDHEEAARVLLQLARPESGYLRDWNNPPGARLLGALAVRGDGVDDGEAERLIGLFYSGFVFGNIATLYPVLKADTKINITALHIFAPEGPGEEGFGYSSRYNALYPFLEAWFDQTGEDYFKLPFFQNWVFHMTHMSGNEYEHRDKFAERRDQPWVGPVPTINLMYEMSLARSNRTAAALAKYHRLRGSRPSLSVRLIFMLRSDPALEAKSPAELGLPTTAHFRVVNSLFARNSWEGIDSAWLWFQSPTWQNIRDLGPVNDFNIWKNGGFLFPKRDQRHDYDGGSRVNTFVLYDARVPATDQATFIQRNVMDRSDGRGLGLDIERQSITQLHAGLVGYSEGLRYFEEQPGRYLYAFGDGERSFSGLADTPSGRKSYGGDLGRLQKWDRQLIWFRTDDNKKSDHFVLYDRLVKPSEAVTEHMMLNFNMKPQIRDQAINTDLGEGQMQVEGIWKYAGANRIVASNTVRTEWTARTPLGTAHARAFVDTLLPKDPIYFRMGGVETRNIDIYGNLNAESLEVRGSADDPQNILWGMWRVQITGRQNQREQRYLHVIQATDVSVESPDPVRLLEGNGLIGACVGSDIALFSSTTQPIVGGALTLPEPFEPLPLGNSGYRLLLADLEPRAPYTVTGGGAEQELAATEAGMIYLDGVVLRSGDLVTVTRRGVAPPPPPPVIRGDVTQDGVVNLRDAIQLLRWIAGQPGRPEPGTDRFLTADINCDGRLTLADFIETLRILMGTSQGQPCGN